MSRGAGRLLATALLGAGLMLPTARSHAFTCSGSMYNSPEFNEKVKVFSPYEKAYLIVECAGLEPGQYTMHANWIHSTRGMIRSDSYTFTTENGSRRGIYFWFRLSRKGPMASMFSGQDFHEENFGDWVVETYLNDQLVVTHPFTIMDAAAP